MQSHKPEPPSRPEGEAKGLVESRTGCVVHITGASGAGTTTLGKAFGARYGHAHWDSDDFFWRPTDPPFTEKRPKEERQRLLVQAVEQAKRSVVSGSLLGWGDVIIPRLYLVVYVATPTDVRLERLIKRETQRFGARLLPGGDMYEAHQDFLAWAARYDTGGQEMRSAARHRAWLGQLSCPVVTVDGTRPVVETLEKLGGWL